MRALDLTKQSPSASQAMGALENRYYIFDTETTGLGADHRIVEIGIVEVINRRPTGREFHKYINPERSIDADAERVHGLSARFLAGKPKFRDIADELLEFLGLAKSAQMVAHNATFDINKLNAEFARLGLSFRIDESFEIIDTMKLSRKIWPGQRATLDAICDRAGVSRSERQESGLHGALVDSRILARVFLAMTAGQEQLGYSEGRQAIAAAGIKLDRSKYGPLKVVYASAEEEAFHTRLCDSIEKTSGYCAFRGKWSRPEKVEPAKVEAQAMPAAEFGSGTVPASTAPHPTQLAKVASIAAAPQVKTTSKSTAPVQVAPQVIVLEVEFEPSI
jgi:DNA polymerase III subunit epsilon